MGTTHKANETAGDFAALQQLVTDRLMDEFDALYVVDLAGNEIRPVRSSRVSRVGAFTDVMPYDAVVRKFTETVDSKYRRDWVNFADVGYMRRYMADVDHREYVYELPGLKKSVRRFCVDVLERRAGAAATLLFSFSGIDEEQARSILLERDMAKAAQHEKFKSDLLAFALRNDDLEAFVDFFAQHVLELYGCDQVIYRDIEGRMILKDKPGAPSLDFSLCRSCPHFAFDAPVYRDGFTAMDDCSEGWKGIPVHKDCPVRASLTYLVYENEKVFGYIALHYLGKTHAFAEYERGTFEGIARFVSLVLSRRKHQQDEAETKRLKAREQELMHAEFRASAVAYLTEHEGDVKSFLDFFADRLRKLIDCDQVIYQGADGVDIINSAPELGDFRLDPKVCGRCAHQDYRSPVYAKGVTELEDHRKGFEGVPVADGCPVKSSLTRIIHLEGRPSGYLAIHYINDYHRFTDRERQTLEEFSNLLSISLSRFAAKEKNAELRRELELKRKIEEQQRQLKKALEDAERTIQRKEVLHRITKSAAWSVRFNEKREIVHTEYSKDLKDVIGNDFDDNEGWIGFIHPEDRERAVSESLAPLMDPSGETKFDSEYRILRRNGGYHWIRSAGRVILDPAGGGEMYGICLDIDETVRRREERQRELEKALTEVREIQNRGELVVDALKSAQWHFSLSADDRIVGWEYSRDIAKIVKNAKAAESYEWSELLHPDDRESAKKAFYATLKDRSGKTPYDVTFRMIDDAGRYNWFRSVGNTFRRADGTGEFYGIHLDITERIEREQAAEERNRMFTEAAKTVYGYNTTVDLENGAMSVIFGKGEKGAQVTLRSARDYPHAMELMLARIRPEYREELLRLVGLDALRKNQHARGVFGTAVYETLDGLWGEITLIFGIGANGKPIANILGRDITEQRREAARIKKLEAAAAQAKIDAAEETSRAKTAFLANMSHDIRTPMNAIIGFTDIARRHLREPEKVDDCLDKVQLAGSTLLEIINDILDMSKIDSNTVEITEYPAFISRMPKYFHTILSTRMKEHGHTFICEAGEHRDETVWIDKPHLNRIVINLLSNALKYTPDGGTIRFRVEQLPDRTASASSDLPSAPATFRITVEDNGMGMSEEFQKHIFERFTREKNSTVSGIQGTGIGMAIVKSLTDAMGGTIEVSSKEGEGTKFTLTFDFRRRRPGEGELAEEELERIIDVGGQTGAAKRLLLVEDNEINREIALEILKGQGFEVDTAVNGREAVEKVGTSVYDLILMDIQMPVMNGLEAAKAIRAAGISVPIIALSANAFSEDREASLAAGMNEHLAKPIKVKELTETLAKFI